MPELVGCCALEVSHFHHGHKDGSLIVPENVNVLQMIPHFSLE
jgi:hypothetical protein